MRIQRRRPEITAEQPSRTTRCLRASNITNVVFQRAVVDLAPAARLRDTQFVATATVVVVERSGPAIRAVLAEHSPQECSQFEEELREALSRTSADLDVSRIDKILTRWHRRATIAANPLTAEERAVLERAKAGDYTGLRVRDEHGGWTTL
jgi:Family of unknown function (DUF6247)